MSKVLNVNETSIKKKKCLINKDQKEMFGKCVTDDENGSLKTLEILLNGEFT